MVVRAAVHEPAHAFDAGADEHVAFTGFDRVKGHSGRLERRRAVTSDGRRRQPIKSEADGDNSRDIEALLATRQSAPQHQVVDLARIELRHLVESGAHDGRGEVVRPQLRQ
jgi:hypothetical protein